jgi:hypothetical protein
MKDEIKRLCSAVYTPAIQDEEFGFKYLPFGVDTECSAASQMSLPITTLSA